MSRELDVVVFGATGFVGKLTAEYLAGHAPDGIRIGLAGRSLAKLERVRDELGGNAAAWTLVAADASDPEALRSLAERSSAIATTVGPYRKYGLPLVKACAEAGTHYADLTGELLFVRDSIDRFHDAASASGARIVHNCGFDSIPSDLGVLLLHDAAKADAAGDLEDTTLVVRSMKGGASGGTIASMKGQLEEMRGSAEVRKLVADPYALSPDRAAEPDLGSEADIRGPVRDEELGMWLAPFVMAAINTRVVRRSNALQDWAYGRKFRYREAMGMGSGPAAPLKAVAVSGGLAALMAGLNLAPTRALLDQVLPDPGEGPSEEARRKGFFKIETHARTSSGARYVCKLEAKGDPGYAATAVMLGETVLGLALDGDRLPDRTGVLTPATGLGSALVDRLRAAGQTLEARPAT